MYIFQGIIVTARFVRDVEAAEFKDGTQGLSEEILTFLKDWYVQHVTHTDRKFGSYPRSKGLA